MALDLLNSNNLEQLALKGLMNNTYVFSCTVSELWRHIGEIIAFDGGDCI